MPLTSIYLDNNSTTPIDPRVVAAMTRAWKDYGANPASQHSLGRKARRVLEDAREGILELLGAKTGGMDADQLIFTSGATEANNLAILGLYDPAETSFQEYIERQNSTEDPPPKSLYVSAMEHPSVLQAAHELPNRYNFCRWFLTVDSLGRIEIPRTFVEPDRGRVFPHLVSVMMANNETGIIQPVAEIAEVAHKDKALVHSDAVQAVGKLRVDFRDLGIDSMTVAAHKFHGPLGIGGLVVRSGLRLEPLFFGGFQQAGLRPGTENVALAVGFHVALQLAISELAERTARVHSLRDELETSLRAELPNIVIIGENAPRLPNTSCISFRGLDRQALVIALDLAGVPCSTGSACASGSSEPSPTLIAMGLPSDVINSAIRLSLSAFTTAEEVTEATRRIINTVKYLRAQK